MTVAPQSSECEWYIFCRRGGDAPNSTACVRVTKAPLTVYLELPDGQMLTKDAARGLASQINSNHKVWKNATCRRTGCTCATSREGQARNTLVVSSTVKERDARNPNVDYSGGENEESDSDESDSDESDSDATDDESPRKLITLKEKITDAPPVENICTNPCIHVVEKDEGARHPLFSERTQVVMRKPFIGYREKPKPFIQFHLTRSFHAYAVQRALESFIDRNGWHECEVFEVHPDAVLALLYASVELDRDASVEAFGIGGFRWIRCPPDSRRVPPERKRTTCDEEFIIPFFDLKSIRDDSDEVPTLDAPIKLMSIDIETDTDGNVIPKHDKNPIYCIVATVGTSPADRLSVCFGWGGEISRPSVMRSILCDTEADMFDAFANFVHRYDPDVFVGYNSDAFDWPYIFGRIGVLGIASRVRTKLSRVVGYNSTLLKTTRFSNQKGTREVVFFDVPGRSFVDMLPYVQSVRQFTSYKLDDVAKKILKSEKLDMPYAEIRSHFNGNPVQRLKLFEYCAVDAELAFSLVYALDALTVLKEESRVAGVLMRHRLANGLQMRLKRKLKEVAFPAGYLVPNHKRIDENSVRVPFYSHFPKRVAEEAVAATADKSNKRQALQTIDGFLTRESSVALRSLPVSSSSSTTSTSSSSTTSTSSSWLRPDARSSADPPPLHKIGTKRRAAPPSSSQVKKRKKAGYKGATVMDVKVNFYGNRRPTIILDFQSLYPNIIISYNLSPDTLLPWNSTAFEGGKFKATNGYEFVNVDVHEGLIPLMCRRFLDKRAEVKKRMKSEKDPVKYRILDGRQAAFKVMANSIYGGCGATSGALFCLQVAETVTAIGRESIETVKNLVLEPNALGEGIVCDVVAGDTDSCFVMVENSSKDAALELGPLIEKRINESGKFGRTQKIAYEAVYCPFLLLAKKKYSALKHESKTKPPEVIQKGTVGVRRDNAIYVSQTHNALMRIAMGTMEERREIMHRHFPAVDDEMLERIRELASLDGDDHAFAFATKEYPTFPVPALRDLLRLSRIEPVRDRLRDIRDRFPLLRPDTYDDEKSCIELYVRRRIFDLLEPTHANVTLEDLTISKNFTKKIKEYKNSHSLDHIRVVKMWKKSAHSITCPRVGMRIPFLFIKTPHTRTQKTKGADKARPPHDVTLDTIDYQYYYVKKFIPAIRDVLRVFFTAEELDGIISVAEWSMRSSYQRVGARVGGVQTYIHTHFKVTRNDMKEEEAEEV